MQASRLHARYARLQVGRRARVFTRTVPPSPLRACGFVSQAGDSHISLRSLWLTPACSTTPPALRSKRYSPAYRPAQHCLSASAVYCSLATLARHQAVVAVVAGPVRFFRACRHCRSSVVAITGVVY